MRHTIVRVTYLDHADTKGGTLDEAIDNAHPVMVEEVGMLLEETEDKLVIAKVMKQWKDDEEEYDGVGVILKADVTEITLYGNRSARDAD